MNKINKSLEAVHTLLINTGTNATVHDGTYLTVEVFE